MISLFLLDAAFVFVDVCIMLVESVKIPVLVSLKVVNSEGVYVVVVVEVNVDVDDDEVVGHVVDVKPSFFSNAF